MAKIVGLSRSIKLEWLNKTVELVQRVRKKFKLKMS